MKKSTKVCLILSAVFLLVGGLLIFFSTYRMGFDGTGRTIARDNPQFDYAVPGTVESIRIETKQADIRVERSPDSACSVRAKIASRDMCTAETVDGVLHVTCNDNSLTQWYNHFWVQDDRFVTVYLPDDEYGKLDITTGSGDVYVSDAFTFAAAETKTGSGDVVFIASVSDDLSVSTSSGDVALKHANSKTVNLSTASGELVLDGSRSDSVSAAAQSGNISLAKCKVKNLQMNTTSGDMILSQIEASESLAASSTSGDVLYLYSTAADMKITTNSGDVTGRVTEPLLYDVQSRSGDVMLPPSGGTHKCTIRTGSGDVDFVLRGSDKS